MDLELATALFSIAAALLEIPIPRKKYKISNLFQIVVSVIFGLFTTSCTKLTSRFRTFGLRRKTGFGIWQYGGHCCRSIPLHFVQVDFSSDKRGLIAITQIRKFKFESLKVASDVAMFTITLVMRLIVLNSLGSIGLGGRIRSTNKPRQESRSNTKSILPSLFFSNTELFNRTFVIKFISSRTWLGKIVYQKEF